MMSTRPLAMVTLLVTSLLSATVLVSPAFAGPTTTSWSGESPAANSSAALAPSAVSVNASSSGALSSASARMTIDGVGYTCFTTNPPSTSGHWEYTEVWDDDAEEYITSQVWVTNPDFTKAKLMTYAWGGPLGKDGDHTAVASIKGADGNVVSDTWTFSVKVPPRIGSPTPASGSSITSTSPVISVPVSDNGTITSWNVTVNGTAVSASLSNGVLRITPTSLPNDSASTVVVTISDAVGATASLTWSFSVQAYGQMPSMRDACLECHPGRDTDPDMTPDCAQCHDGVLDTPHEGDPATFHTRADASCAPCHARSLPNEHARRTSAPNTPLTCLTCHKSSNPKVVSAIASRNSNCWTCHDDAGTAHDGVGAAAKHTPAFASATCTMAGCHATTNISSLHSSATTTVAGEDRTSCGVCHAAGTPPGPECSNCHANKLTTGGVVAEHGVDPARHEGSDATARSGGIGIGCSGQPGRTIGCHNISNLPALHSGAPGGPCAVCHGPGKTPSTDCRSCHPTGSGLPTANSLAGTGVYHHRNVKYLNDSTDATTSPYYWMGEGDPAHGWNNTLFLQECTSNCHIMHYGP